MVDAGRISGTVGTRKAKKRKEIQWARIGTTKPDEAAVSRVHNQHACPLVERDPDVTGRGRMKSSEWDVSSLSPDQLLALWHSLGVRVSEGRERSTQGQMLNADPAVFP